MSEDRENNDNATAGDSLLKPDESKENVAVDISDNQALASPAAKMEVTYVNADSQNGDAKIDIAGDLKEFAGMGKAELMRFANDPFWVRTRWILFSLFWLLWLSMLAGAIAIIVLAPRCAVSKKAQWWEQSPLYEINVRSFKDGSSMADGIGDIQGLRSKLDYISKDLGVSGVILSSIYPTGSDTNPESVIDFLAIHPDIGTQTEFKELIADLKRRGLRLVLDMVPNHTGKQHKWFQDSVKKVAPYKDYYVWSAGKGSDTKNQPPNNWKSLTGGSAWEWNEERNEFYLHQFAVGQPDLNFRNAAVQDEFNRIFKFWLDLGVSGFQLQKTAYLVEDYSLGDEQLGAKPGTTLESYDFYSHKQTKYLYESFKLVGQWRAVVSNTSDTVLFVKDEFPLMDYEHNKKGDNSTAAAEDLLQTPEFLQSVSSEITAQDLSSSIQKAIVRAGSQKSVWRLGGEDSQRLASKFSGGLADAMLMVSLLLPGTPIVYYGDEIGLLDVPQETAKRALGPMQWNSSSNAGFTSDSISPWVKINNPKEINVADQLQATDSHLKIFKELVEARKTMVAINLGETKITVLNGTRADGSVVAQSILAFTRIKSGSPGVLVAVNPSKDELSVNFSAIPGMADELTVHVKSSGFSNPALQAKSKTPRDAVKLPAKSGITFTFVYKGEE